MGPELRSILMLSKKREIEKIQNNINMDHQKENKKAYDNYYHIVLVLKNKKINN